MDEPDPSGRPPFRESRPVPDPTALTQKLVDAAMASMMNFVNEKFNASERINAAERAVIVTRIDGMDKAVRLVHEIADKLPGMMKDEIRHQEALMSQRFLEQDVKFQGIEKQLEEKEKRTDQTARDGKTAIDAAFAAQDKASIKTENTFSQQIRTQGELLAAMTQALDGKIDDLKSRVSEISSTMASLATAIASKATGIQETLKTSADHSQNVTQNSGMWLGIVVAAAVGIGAIVLELAKK